MKLFGRLPAFYIFVVAVININVRGLQKLAFYCAKKGEEFWKEIAFLDILVKMAELKMWLIHIHKIALQQSQDI